MSKQISWRNGTDTAALPPYAGEVAEGGNIIQNGLLKNTGTEALSSIKLKVTNEPGLPGTLAASVNGVALSQVETEVLSAPLAPGATVGIVLTWTVPGNIIEGEDSASITGSVS